MKGAVELMIKLLLLLWIHSMVECRPITCPLARNFVKYGPNGEIVDCRPCPECAEGHGLSIQCGSQIANDSKIECVSCKLNKTYSDSHGIGSCRTCQYCGLRNVIRQCSPSQNRICGNKCPKGYFFDDNINDCLEVKSETATAKSTESTPTVHQDPDHSTTAKRHLKMEAYEDTIAISRHSVQIKPSSIQQQHSSLVVGIAPTATPLGTTKVALQTENDYTASVLPTKNVQQLIIITIVIVTPPVFMLLSMLVINIVNRARQASPRTQPELRGSAEETNIPLNCKIDEIEDSSDATISSFTTRGLNYCGAQLFIKYLYDWKRNIEPHDNQSLFTICKLALSQLILGARKEIDTCNYFAVELSALSQENLSKTVICLKTGSA